MTDPRVPDEREDRRLEAALRAAFEEGPVASAWGASTLATLDTHVGSCRRVLLRDTEDDPIVTPAARELIGSNQDGSRYQVMGEIARGGVGVVLKSRDVDLGRDVAMKALRPEHQDNPSMVHRFIEEAQIAGQLQHPGILPVYELGLRDERTPYFTMKLVRGDTLAARFESGAAAERSASIKVFEQICQTLAYAHAKGVIHRDLKPSNVLVGAFGEVQVVDWGLAKVLAKGGVADEGGVADTHMDLAVETVRTSSTQADSLVGSVMGTPAYMPPEQARGEVAKLDERADVFALGAILCEILTGKPPFTGESHEILAKARDGDLSEGLGNLEACDADDELKSIARACLAPRATDRPRNAGVVRDLIEGYLTSTAERARVAELSAARAEAQASEERRTRRWISIAAAAVVVAVLGAAAGAFWFQNREQQRLAEGSADLHELVDRASDRLAVATSSDVGVSAPWFEARTAMQLVRDVLEHPRDLDEPSRARAASFLARFERADADRAISESIEQAVIFGATNLDPVSWTRMERDLREAFLDYGVDVTSTDHRAIVAGLRESELAAQLTDGYELWMATAVQLRNMGVELYPEADLMARIPILNEADPDPFAREVRTLLYSAQPTKEQIDDLLRRYPDLTQVRPRTLSWLAGICFRTAAPERLDEIFRRGLVLYADDVMLNFDYAFHLRLQRRNEEAVRYYLRCLALRPRTPNLWRALASLLREVGEDVQASDALVRCTQLDPDNAAVWAELGSVRVALSNPEAARAAFERALELDPDNEEARAGIEALDAEGRNPR